jgi:hypothetical protein
MKKSLVTLGLVFLGLLAVAVIGIAIMAWKGTELDKESKAYVDTAVPAIVTSWDQQQLMDRACTQLTQATTPNDLDRLFAWFRTLGRLKSYQGCQGQAKIAVTSGTGKTISAHYTAKASFENGYAAIEVNLVKAGDLWKIAGFRVNSPQLR